MRRRDFLATTGLGIVSSVAGCSSRSGTQSDDSASDTAPFEHPGTLTETFVANGDYPSDETPADGYPPAFPNPPEQPTVDESSFPTKSVNGETVKLAPIDTVWKWFQRSEARFVDARGLTQYKRSHIYGSVLSTAQRESTGGSIDGWSKDARTITYCGCPHHLSSLRAAGLQKAGYTNVYALDEGFGEWSARGYPMAGTKFGTTTQSDVSEWTIEGTVDERHAGEYAWAKAGRQYEAAPIQENGHFTLHLKFSDVTGETPVRVSTPAFTVTQSLNDLTSGRIRG